MFFKLLSIFLVIPIIELYLLLKVGGMIGALNTVLIILITASLGAYLAKSQGFRVLREIQKAKYAINSYCVNPYFYMGF